MTALLPLFYFKPSICCIDDDPVLLDALHLSLKTEYPCLRFKNAEEASKYINSYQAPLSKLTFKQEFRESDLFGTQHHWPVDINIPLIKNILNLPHKSQEIAVLIIDYQMPELNGLDFCEQLKSLPIKKILLTGNLTPEKAIEAFNRGLIHKFIKKDSDLTQQLDIYLKELSYQYFRDKTSDLIAHIEASRLSPLSDQKFIDFFTFWCGQNNIEEFYLLNRQGSFLLKNKDNQLSYFILLSESDKLEFLKLHDEVFDQATYLFNELSTGKMIPYFGLDKESWDFELSEWPQYFYPAKSIYGRETYYWAVVPATVK